MEGSPISNTRLVLTLVVIGGCFIVLYPKLFHPIFMNLFGFRDEKPKQPTQETVPPHHPRMNMHPHHPAAGVQEEMKKHMRPGAHPGMRAASEMKQQQTHGSGRGGIMGVVLPVYAVGIVLYLVYTLFKVFNKQGKGDLKQKQERQRRMFAPARVEKNELPEESDEPSPKDTVLPKLDNIEEILTNMEDKNISEEQMQELQKRLIETEAQMAKIMKAMQSISEKMASPQSKEDDKTNSGTLKEDKDEKDKTDKPVENISHGKKEEADSIADERDTTISEETTEEKSKEDRDEPQEVEVLMKKKQVEEEDSNVRKRHTQTEVSQ